MYKIAKIYIQLPDNSEGKSDLIMDYLVKLYKNGQILDKYLVVKVDNHYIATVTTTDDDSLDDRYNNIYVNQCLKNLSLRYEIIGDDVFSNDSCHCNDPSWFMLYSDYIESSSPIICGDCGKEIPLIKIPYISNQNEHFTILAWQEMYQSVDSLWMSSLSDRFAKNQIINPNSQLNKSGIDLCNELSKELKKPVYLFVRNPIGGFYQYKTNNQILEVCPKCGENLIPLKRQETVDKVCERCKLAF